MALAVVVEGEVRPLSAFMSWSWYIPAKNMFGWHAVNLESHILQACVSSWQVQEYLYLYLQLHMTYMFSPQAEPRHNTHSDSTSELFSLACHSFFSTPQLLTLWYSLGDCWMSWCYCCWLQETKMRMLLMKFHLLADHVINLHLCTMDGTTQMACEQNTLTVIHRREFNIEWYNVYSSS